MADEKTDVWTVEAPGWLLRNGERAGAVLEPHAASLRAALALPDMDPDERAPALLQRVRVADDHEALRDINNELGGAWARGFERGAALARPEPAGDAPDISERARQWAVDLVGLIVELQRHGDVPEASRIASDLEAFAKPYLDRLRDAVPGPKSDCAHCGEAYEDHLRCPESHVATWYEPCAAGEKDARPESEAVRRWREVPAVQRTRLIATLCVSAGMAECVAAEVLSLHSEDIDLVGLPAEPDGEEAS